VSVAERKPILHILIGVLNFKMIDCDFMCVHAEGIYSYTKKGSFTKIKEGETLYGLTWDQYGNVFISTNTSIRRFDTKNNGEEKVWSSNKNLIGLHQIVHYDDFLYIANTGANKISVFDSNENFSHVLMSPEPSVTKLKHGPQKEQDHINSIFKHGEHFYLCAHNHFEHSFIIVCNSKFEIVKLIKDVGFQCHNVYIEDNILYVLSSIKGSVTKCNLLTDERESVFLDLSGYIDDKIELYLRGLARGKGKFLIGATLLGDKEKRKKSRNWIVETDDNLSVKAVLECPDASQIREIRIINEVDRAHNEIIFNYAR